jgi:hypothetical protein
MLELAARAENKANSRSLTPSAEYAAGIPFGELRAGGMTT